MTPPEQRELAVTDHMSPAEAMMWAIEADPWLDPSGSALCTYDQPVDLERLRHVMRVAVADLRRLRDRVVEADPTPVWRTDPEFDMDRHVTRIELPTPGTMRQLLDLAAELHVEPFDRSHPLWRFVVIDGLEDGRGALFQKQHHSISDGIGAVRMAEAYLDFDAQGVERPDVDIDAIIADALEAEEPPPSSGTSAGRAVAEAAALPLKAARSVAGELGMMSVDPLRLRDHVRKAIKLARNTSEQLAPEAEGAPLWRNRSGRRHLEVLELDLAEVKASAHARGGSVNDLFVAGAVEASVRYHEQFGAALERLHLSFVLSTRTDDLAGGNAFTPVPFTVELDGTDLDTRFERVRDLMAAKRGDTEGAVTLGGVAALVHRLPTPLITRIARGQAARMDFATSNLRASPVDVWVAGAKLLATYPLGPVAGTAFNLTTLSYAGTLDVGLFCDPAAVTEPARLRECLVDSYADLMA